MLHYSIPLPCLDASALPEQSIEWLLPADFIAESVWSDAHWDWAERIGPVAFIMPNMRESIRQAILLGERIPVLASVADLLQPNSSAVRSEIKAPRTFRCTVERREHLEGLAQEERAREEAKACAAERERAFAEERERAAAKARKQGGILKAIWRAFVNDL